MVNYQSACSGGTPFLGPCHQNQHPGNSVEIYTNNLYPFPIAQAGTPPNSGGTCDCTETYDPTAYSIKFDSTKLDLEKFSSVIPLIAEGRDRSTPTVDEPYDWQSAFFTFAEWWLNDIDNTDMLALQTYSDSSTSQAFNNCSNFGFKNVAGRRQWHGVYAWDTPGICTGCGDPVAIATPADTTKYLTCRIIATLHSTFVDAEGGVPLGDWSTIDANISGDVTIDPVTGIIASTLSSTETETRAAIGGISYYCHNGAGYSNYGGGDVVNFCAGGSTILDACYVDLHCANVPVAGILSSSGGAITIDELPGTFNAEAENAQYNWTVDGGSSGPGEPTFTMTLMSAVTDTNSYTGSGSYSESINDFDLDDNPYVQTTTISATCTWSRVGTVYTWDYTWSESWNDGDVDPLGDVTYTTTAHGTGSMTLLDTGLNTNSYFDILADIEDNLLITWNLADNAVYPWRYVDAGSGQPDVGTSFMPLVTRREVQYNRDMFEYGFIPATMDDLSSPTTDPCYPSGFYQIAWQDPNSYYWEQNTLGTIVGLGNNHFDGAVIGAPLAYNNYGVPIGSIGNGWFDFYFDNIRFCLPDPDACPGSLWTGYNYAYGGTLGDATVSVEGIPTGGSYTFFLPQTATHWTNNKQAHFLSRGAIRTCLETAYDSFGDTIVVDDGIYSTKWAETRLPAPHQNYFRPCGSDRVLIDNTSSQCFNSDGTIAGSLGNTANPLTTSSTVLIFNPPSAFSVHAPQGLYTGCHQTPLGDGSGNYHLIVGPGPTPLPSDYELLLGETYGNGIAGIVRFPNAPAICGKVAVSTSTTDSYTNGSDTDIIFSAPQTNLRSGDQIQLYDSSMHSLGSWTVTKVGTTNVNFLVGSTAVSSAVWATSVYDSSGNPINLGWYDSSPKFEFRTNYWFTSQRNSDFNTSGECSQNCLPFSPCKEQVVFLVPPSNPESAPNSVNIWYPSVASMDGLCGSYQQLNVEFWMNDLLYQPPNPCGAAQSDLSLQEDNGSCQTSTSSTVYYPFPPQVEAVCSPPLGAPLPSGVTIPPMVQPPIAGLVGTSFTLNGLEPWAVYQNAINNDCCINNNWCT